MGFYWFSHFGLLSISVHILIDNLQGRPEAAASSSTE
jgi:hypothetical protein